MGTEAALTKSVIVPLDDAQQTRNLVLVAVNTSLSYFASSVLYVGVVHAALGEQLGVSATVANIPGAVRLMMSALPLIVAWAFPRSSQLKPILITGYTSLAIGSALVAAVLFWPAPTWLRMAILILHGGVVGAHTVVVAYEFEVLGRAVSAARRGTALGLAYGIGPILAIVGALAAQLLLTGRLGPLAGFDIAFPTNFAVLFAATVPILALAAFLSSRYVIPMADDEVTAHTSAGPFTGLGEFLGRPVVRRAMLATILVLAGFQILSNMTLYTRVILNDAPSQFAGYQNMVRFGGKAAAGVFFGWLLARTGPRVVLFVSAAIGLAGVLAAVVTSETWFLAGFGLVGAGELFGVYATNYILCTAPPAQMRRYMAFTMLVMFPIAPASVLFGAIADMPSAPALGFQMSFVAAALFIVVGIALAILLPSKPKPEEAEVASAPMHLWKAERGDREYGLGME